MEERLPSQIYVVGNFLLLLVVVLAFLMMPRAMALDPRTSGSLSGEDWFEHVAGLDRLGASGLPELRIWAAPDPAAASSVIVTPSTIERFDLSGGEDGRAGLQITRRIRKPTPLAAQAILRARDLASYDSHYLVCGRGEGGLSVSGYVDGRAFSYHEAGDCAGMRPVDVEAFLRLLADQR
jgi:hypothetical protein